jgi:DNA-binding transcriptional MerR regulator
MKPRVLNLLPEEDRALARLWLNATDAAKVCGVTVRQLTYWTDKGIVPSSSNNGRSYDVAGLNRAVAIDRAMSGGLTLEKAARLLDEAPVSSGSVDDLSVGVTIDALVADIESYRRRFPAYLALANFRRAAAAVEAIEVERVLGNGPEAGAIAQRVASRLNAVADMVDAAASDILAPSASTAGLSEMAGAGTAL